MTISAIDASQENTILTTYKAQQPSQNVDDLSFQNTKKSHKREVSKSTFIQLSTLIGLAGISGLLVFKNLTKDHKQEESSGSFNARA